MVAFDFNVTACFFLWKETSDIDFPIRCPTALTLSKFADTVRPCWWGSWLKGLTSLTVFIGAWVSHFILGWVQSVFLHCNHCSPVSSCMEWLTSAHAAINSRQIRRGVYMNPRPLVSPHHFDASHQHLLIDQVTRKPCQIVIAPSGGLATFEKTFQFVCLGVWEFNHHLQNKYMQTWHTNCALLLQNMVTYLELSRCTSHFPVISFLMSLRSIFTISMWWSQSLLVLFLPECLSPLQLHLLRMTSSSTRSFAPLKTNPQLF